jgi:hypothetical protein
MRAARIIGEGMSYYHGMSRVIERAFVLNDDEKERFRILLRKTASFSGVTVLTHLESWGESWGSPTKASGQLDSEGVSLRSLLPDIFLLVPKLCFHPLKHVEDNRAD